MYNVIQNNVQSPLGELTAGGARRRRRRGCSGVGPEGGRVLRATETMLAETMFADLRARVARVCRCSCTGCTTKKYSYFLSGTFFVVQPVHLHQHTPAARARKSANMVSVLPRYAEQCHGPEHSQTRWLYMNK